MNEAKQTTCLYMEWLEFIMYPFAAKLPSTIAPEEKSPSVPVGQLANAKLGHFFATKPQSEKDKEAKDQGDKENSLNESEATHLTTALMPSSETVIE